jgi:hypothetical protein
MNRQTLLANWAEYRPRVVIIGGEKRIVCHGSQSAVRQMPRPVERSLSRARRARQIYKRLKDI